MFETVIYDIKLYHIYLQVLTQNQVVLKKRVKNHWIGWLEEIKMNQS
jgi:hypothetical protein